MSDHGDPYCTCGHPQSFHDVNERVRAHLYTLAYTLARSLGLADKAARVVLTRRMAQGQQFTAAELLEGYYIAIAGALHGSCVLSAHDLAEALGDAELAAELVEIATSERESILENPQPLGTPPKGQAH